MLSAVDLERLIAVKRLEINKEKTFLGLSSPETSGVSNFLTYMHGGNLLIRDCGDPYRFYVVVGSAVSIQLHAAPVRAVARRNSLFCK